MDPTRLNRMCLAPEGDFGGGGASEGVPAAPPPASPPSHAEAPAPRVPYVPPPDDDSSPAQPGGPRAAAPRPGEPGAAPPNGSEPVNHIPYARVKQMLAQERARAMQEAQQQFSQRQPDPQAQLRIVREALKLAGIDVPDEADPQDRPLTRAEAMQFFQQQQQQTTQALQLRSEYESGVRDLESGKAKHADYFAADPMLESRCKALFGVHDDLTMGQIIEQEVQRLDAFYNGRTQAYAQRKVNDRRVATPVRPGGAPGAARQPQHDLSTSDGQDAALDELLGE